MRVSYDSLPLPSIFCLITIGFFPFIARQTHSIWRAVQAYDSQVTTINKDSNNGSKSKYIKSKGHAVSIILSITMLGFFLTSGGQWQKDYPALAAMRNCLPEVVFMAVVPLTVISALSYFLHPWPTAISRQESSTEKGKDVINTKQLIKSFKTPAQLFQFRLLFVSVIFAFIWMLQVTGMKYAIPFMATAGLIFFLQACHLPVFYKDALTFRMLCLYPLAFLAFTLAILAVSFGIIYGILTFFPQVFSDHSTAKESEASGVEAVFYDLATNQMMSLAYPFLWIYITISPLILVGMAYRFDMAQAGLSAPTLVEKQEMIKASNQPKDKTGRSPVLLHTAALPKSVLATVSTPTFHVAMSTLSVTLIVGVIVECSVGWTGYTIMPMSLTQLPLDRTDVLSLWPLLAYPLMLAAMLIRAKAESQEAFVNLWTYREDWSRLDPKSSLSEEKETIA